MLNVNEILLYTTKNGEIKIDVLYGDQNIWLTQKKMSLLFGVQIPAINKHLKNIFESGELIEESVISILETTAEDEYAKYRVIQVANLANPTTMMSNENHLFKLI